MTLTRQLARIMHPSEETSQSITERDNIRPIKSNKLYLLSSWVATLKCTPFAGVSVVY